MGVKWHFTVTLSFHFSDDQWHVSLHLLLCHRMSLLVMCLLKNLLPLYLAGRLGFFLVKSDSSLYIWTTSTLWDIILLYFFSSHALSYSSPNSVLFSFRVILLGAYLRNQGILPQPHGMQSFSNLPHLVFCFYVRTFWVEFCKGWDVNGFG